jgi:hypothetical protein
MGHLSTFLKKPFSKTALIINEVTGVISFQQFYSQTCDGHNIKTILALAYEN